MSKETAFEDLHRIWTQQLLDAVPCPESTITTQSPRIFMDTAVEWSMKLAGHCKIVAQVDFFNHLVYQIDVIDYKTNTQTRWYDYHHVIRYTNNLFERQMDPMTGESPSIEVIVKTSPSPDEIIEYARDLVEGITYNDDGTVNIPIDFTDEEFLAVARAAHELDITINEYMEKAVTEAIEHEKIINKMHNDWLV